MNTGKTIFGTGLFLVACAACCAPLVAPPIIAAIAAGGAGLALVGQLGLALVVVAAGVFFLLSRRKALPNADFQTLMAAGKCGCGPSCDTASEEKPIACTLDAGDFKERAVVIRDLARRSLRHVSRTPLTLELTYEPEALDEVRNLVTKERACCAFLTFDLTSNAQGVFLTIIAPQSATDSADVLFDHFAPELAASNFKETA